MGRPLTILKKTHPLNMITVILTRLSANPLNLIAVSYDGAKPACAVGPYNPRCYGLEINAVNMELDVDPYTQTLIITP